MEEKKSSKADLEGKRWQRFVLGLVVAVACLVVALEYSYTSSSGDDDEELLESFTIESDLPPLLPPDNELALAPKVEPKPAQQIVVVEDDEEPAPQQEEELVETDMDSDMEALDDEEPIAPPEEKDDDVVDFRVVEDLPQFPGGATELMKWLTRNLKYPQSVQDSKQQGRVVAQFIVNKDGSVTDVKIVSSFNQQCDNEVLRVLRMMPRWTAGLMKGEPCRTMVCIPVVFRM